jgi:hypothetical protein
MIFQHHIARVTPSQASMFVSFSSASCVDVQGVSVYTAKNMDVQGVSLPTAKSMDVQGASLSTTSSVNVRGVSQSIACNYERAECMYPFAPL